MGRVVQYAVATTMRQEEICRPDCACDELKTEDLHFHDPRHEGPS